MNRSTSKIISIVLILMFTAVMFAGCGGEAVSQESNLSQTSAEVSASATVETTEPEATFDLGGRTIKILAWWDETPKPGSEEGDLLVQRRAEVESKFNCKFEYAIMPADDILPKFSAAAMAGEPIADIVFMRSFWAFPSLASKGYLCELDGLFDFAKPYYNQSIKEIATLNGKTYGFSTYLNGCNSGVYFNKAIFERDGLENLYDLVKNNQWTWDKYLEIAKKATKDTNGDGKIDQWGIGDLLPQFFIYSNNGSFNRVVDGKAVSTLTEENTIEGLEYVNKLNNVEKVAEIRPKDGQWDYGMKQFKSGKYAMFAGGWWMTEDFKKNMSDKYGMVPFPKGPKAQDYMNFSDELSVRVLSASLKDAKQIAAAYDAYVKPLTDNAEELTRSAVESRTWDKESVDNYFLIAKNQTYTDFNAYPGIWDFLMPALNSAASGEKAAKVAMEEINQKWQESIDKTLGK